MSTRTIKTIADNKKTLQVKTYNSFDALENLQQEWDSFVESNAGDIFMTYDWCRIWWKYYGDNRSLRVFFFRSNNKLVGIIPLFFEKLWLGPVPVRAGKIVGSDFTISQFSIPLANGYMKAVIESFSELLSEEKWDIVHIGPVAGLYEHYSDLKDACEELLHNSYLVQSEDKSVQTYFQLADDWEKQLVRLRKGERKHIKKSYRFLHTQTSPIVSSFSSTDNFEQIFDNFVNMHQSYWTNLGRLGHFADWPAASKFHHEVAAAQLRQGRLRLLEVRSGERCLGYEYAYKFGERYFAFLYARSNVKEFSKISIWSVIFSELLKKALSEGVKCIDSMRGKYEHKLRLGGKLFPVRSLYIVPDKLFVSIRINIFRALAWLLDTCYYKIWFCRIAPKLPIKRRPLWKIWIRTSGIW